MKLTGNTIFITGGGSGIGRGLAEALHKLGNKVIIAGRSKERLEETINANPGMSAVVLNIQDPANVKSVAQQLIEEYPDLNVLFNNAGIYVPDDPSDVVDEDVLVQTVNTNLLGPVRMASALLGHLKSKDEAYIINTTSILGFVPVVRGAIYSATKAALHSYTLTQRYILKDTSVRVLEIAPPLVQTQMMNYDPNVMPLVPFIEETMQVLGTDTDEVLVEEAKMYRNNPGPNEGILVNQVNDMLTGQ
ncbi:MULTISPECIES: SDR family NAD(P)-dependent oxidoreductase [unclassified Paenibacillus]|uniref:SDR family oxidoreductase n=1 Tax=unclassified Paenibacillus TaxID=185978 RepID=UPI0017886B32|nr:MULTISPECIES: SDR family NAD(P)-dependent oxidoreductase [unclassified Paenibacillus]MBE0339665.1 SDR family NAD(P)-dependent oxidoreductase [Paenibacillus sp. 23TSA30-6]QYK67454.1 short chain dehydrogenase [Paenibacillus sp. S02]